MDGMNEKGLCVAVLMIEDRPAFSQDTGKPDLTTTTAVRLLLDRAASVEEAVELLSGYDLHASAGMMVHFSIADASGRSVAVEYIDNEMRVVETDMGLAQKNPISGMKFWMLFYKNEKLLPWKTCGMR